MNTYQYQYQGTVERCWVPGTRVPGTRYLMLDPLEVDNSLRKYIQDCHKATISTVAPCIALGDDKRLLSSRWEAQLHNVRRTKRHAVNTYIPVPCYVDVIDPST